DRAGGGASAAGEVPRRGGPLLLGGPDAGAGRGAPRLPAGDRPQPTGPRPRPPASAIDSPRSRPTGRNRDIEVRCPIDRAGSAESARLVGDRGGQSGLLWSSGRSPHHGRRRPSVRWSLGSERTQEEGDDAVEVDRDRPVVP